jgi:hydroxymethylbilane synthase
MNKNILKIGTRGSPLALVQANMVKDALRKAHKDLDVEIVVIQSNADWNPADGEKPLCEEDGGKGLFASEIEEQIAAGSVDCGVHSLKDMASFLPEGLVINHYLSRADVRDVLISVKYNSIRDLPAGCVVGTCSLRRASMVLSHNPSVEIVPFRGNVQTRLNKVRDGQVDATLLAKAGLDRLGLSVPESHVIEPEEMLPACGQGIVCIETRQGDTQTQSLLDAISCMPTSYCAVAEREVLRILDGSCHTPIGAYAVLEGDMLYLRALVASNDGQEIYRDEYRAKVTNKDEALAVGQIVGQRLKDVVPEGFLE